MESHEGSRIGLLERESEYLNLIWPGIIFLTLLITRFFFANLTRSTKDIVQILAAVLFLNVIHNLFSVYILFLPAGKAWIAELSPRRRFQLVGKWSVIVILIVGFFAFGKHWIESHSRNPNIVLMMTIALTFMTQFYHTLRQMRGIAIAYNKRIEMALQLDAATLLRFRRHERWERGLFSALLWTCGLSLATMTLAPANYWFLPFTIASIFTVALLLNSLSFPAAARSWKFYYLLRLGLVPVSLIDPIFSLAIPCFHGVEHGFIFREMWRKSEFPPPHARSVLHRVLWSRKTLISLCLLTGVFALLRISPGFGGQIIYHWPQYTLWITYASVASTAFAYIHIYLDSQIFRMQDPLLRKHIGPLLHR